MRTTVSLQYAKAIFDLAKEENLVDEYAAYLEMAGKIFIDDTNTFKTFQHPSVSNEERIEIIDKCLKDYVTSTFLNYVKVLVENNRLVEIKDIYESYQSLLDEHHHQCNATIYMMFDPDDEEKKFLISTLEKKYNKKVNLTIKLDQTLVGGMKIIVDGKVMDATIKNQMLDLKNELKKGW